MKRSAILGMVIAFLGAPLIGATQVGAASVQVTSFAKYTTTVERDLSYCTSSLTNVQAELAQVLQGVASSSLYVALDNAAKKALTNCEARKDPHVSNLDALRVPSQISWIQSLRRSNTDAERWANDDSTKVLEDVQSFVESDGGYVAAATLDADVLTADADAASLRAAFSHAAQRLHVLFLGLGLVVWSS